MGESGARVQRQQPAAEPQGPLGVGRLAREVVRGKAAPGTATATAQGQGAPLQPDVRREFQHRLGHDFGSVRVHTGNEAERATASLNASGFTLGRNVVLGGGVSDQASPAGRRILAHELRHVVQQAGFLDRELGGAPVLDASHPSEREARAETGLLTPLAAPAVQLGPPDLIAKPLPGAVDIGALLARRVPKLLPLIPAYNIHELQKRANERAKRAGIERQLGALTHEAPYFELPYGQGRGGSSESIKRYERKQRRLEAERERHPEPEGTDEIWFRTEQVLDDDVYPPPGRPSTPEDELRGIILSDMLRAPLVTLEIAKRPGSAMEGSGWVDDVTIRWNGTALPNTDGLVTFADLTRGPSAPYRRPYEWLVTGPLAAEIKDTIATVDRADVQLQAMLDAGEEHPYVKRFASTYGGRWTTPDPDRDTFGRASSALAAAERLYRQGHIEDARRQLAFASGLANEALGEAGHFENSMMTGAGRGVTAARVAEFAAKLPLIESPLAFSLVSTEERGLEEYRTTGSIDPIRLAREGVTDYAMGRLTPRLQSRLGLPETGLGGVLSTAALTTAEAPVDALARGRPMPRSVGDYVDLFSFQALIGLGFGIGRALTRRPGQSFAEGGREEAPDPKVAGLRRQIRGEFETGKGKDPLKHGLAEEDLNKEWKAVRGKIRSLPSTPANNFVKANIDRVYAAVRSPKLIEDVMVQIWKRAKQDTISTTEALKRIVKERLDVSADAEFPELTTLEPHGSERFRQIIRNDLPFLDQEFASDYHLAYTHAFQELVVARALGSKQAAALFRKALADTDKGTKLWADLWNAVYDSVDEGHVNTPEDLGRRLLVEILGIEKTNP